MARLLFKRGCGEENHNSFTKEKKVCLGLLCPAKVHQEEITSNPVYCQITKELNILLNS